MLVSLHLGCSFSRIGFALSVMGPLRYGGSLSLLDFSMTGSSASLKGLCLTWLGALHPRPEWFFDLGARLSQHGLRCFGPSSVWIRFFSASLYETGNLGPAVSMLNYVSLPSSLFTRSVSRCGFSLPAYGASRLGPSSPTLDHCSFGPTATKEGFPPDRAGTLNRGLCKGLLLL